MIRIPRSWPWWRWVLTGLISLGLALSIYLSWHYLLGTAVIGCGGGSPCEQVLSSRWSEVAGVLPVSGLAAGAYLAMLVASLFTGPATAALDRRLAWGAILVLVGAAAGSAVWFIIVQIWLIGAFCAYCMVTHITGLSLAALVIWRATMQFDESTGVAPTSSAPSPDVGVAMSATPNAKTGGTIASPLQEVGSIAPRRIIGLLPMIGLLLVGLALAGILAACQVVFVSPGTYRGGQSPGNGQPAIIPRAVPLVGTTDALYVVSLFFDYKCPHCQQLHFMLDEVIRRYGGKLAFALCPAPLSRKCNPYVPRDVEEFKDSCELVKVGLAVWVAKREAFPGFNRWMFSLESGDRWQPRSLDAAKAKAIELVGQAEFAAAWADPWVERYMQASIRVYGDAGGNAIPKLVFGSRWVTPEPYNADDLVVILHDGLALPGP
jgi:uncharacterized membrane protein/protein-disulfide isomerase